MSVEAGYRGPLPAAGDLSCIAHRPVGRRPTGREVVERLGPRELIVHVVSGSLRIRPTTD